MFTPIPIHLLSMDELQERLTYYRKREYRLLKLKRLGKDVEPDLEVCQVLANKLDIEWRERVIASADIPI